MLPNHLEVSCKFVGFVFKQGGLLFFNVEPGTLAGDRLKRLDRAATAGYLSDLEIVLLETDEKFRDFLMRESTYRANTLPVEARQIREAKGAQA